MKVEGWTPEIWDHVLWVGLRRWMSFLQCLAEAGLGLLCGSNWFPRESKANFSLAPRDTNTCGIESRWQNTMCRGLSFGLAIPTPRKEDKENGLLETQNRLYGTRETLMTGIVRTRGLLPFSLVTDHETKAPRDACTWPQEEDTNAAVIVSQKMWFPVSGSDQWGFTSLPPRIPFIMSPHGLPENPVIYITILSKFHEPHNATTLSYYNL